MANMLEFENRLRTELTYKANRIQPLEELPQNILLGIEKRHMEEAGKIRLRKYVTAVACAVLVCIGTLFISSTDVRTMAMGVITNVFVMDNNNQVVEKSANEVFMPTQVSYSTNRSDEELSNKINTNLYFPQILDGDLQLIAKSDGVGLVDGVAYDIHQDIINQATTAINSEQEFKKLSQYHPYRCIGGEYGVGNEVKVVINVYNQKLPIPSTNICQIKTIETTKVKGSEALWIELSGLNNANDLTQKTTDKVVGYTLFWTTDHASYNIAPTEGQTLTLDNAIKYAEDFMTAQK